jgi:hypothetical protein
VALESEGDASGLSRNLASIILKQGAAGFAAGRSWELFIQALRIHGVLVRAFSSRSSRKPSDSDTQVPYADGGAPSYDQLGSLQLPASVLWMQMKPPRAVSVAFRLQRHPIAARGSELVNERTPP